MSKILITGLSPLHQAIINEDPAMVLFLLRHGADVNQRCYGAFFCPNDQKSNRQDSLEHEYVELSLRTNYDGYENYWLEIFFILSCLLGIFLNYEIFKNCLNLIIIHSMKAKK